MKPVAVLWNVLVLLILQRPDGVFSEEPRTVISEGVAAVQQDSSDPARTAAIEDARKKAVEQAVGILIGPKAQVEKYQVIRDTILSRAADYVKTWAVLGERTDSGLLRVRISAAIAWDRLAGDLAANGIRSDPANSAGAVRTIAVTATGITEAQFVQFKKLLKEQVQDIRSVSEGSLRGKTARFRVDTGKTVQTLADELGRKDLGGFSFEVVGSTADSLELTLAPRKN